MVLPRATEVSVGALDWLVRQENIGELHLILAPANRWFPPGTDHERDAPARAEIEALGWYDRDGRLDVEVAVALAVLCRPKVEIFGWITSAGRTWRVLGAAIGREALLALVDGESVWLGQIPAGQVAARVVAQAPDLPAARGKPFIVSRREVLATRGGRVRSETGVHLVHASPEVRLAKELAALPTTGCGELYVAVRDGMGRRRQVEQPVRWADCAAGRWVNHAQGARVRVAPATRADLVALLGELRRTLAG